MTEWLAIGSWARDVGCNMVGRSWCGGSIFFWTCIIAEDMIAIGMFLLATGKDPDP